MRKLIRKSAGWIHSALIMAIIIPLLYALGTDAQDMTGRGLFYKCLVILFPIVTTDFAIEKCRSLFSYLAACILILAATGALCLVVAGPLRRSVLFWGYMLILLAQTVFVIVERMSERLDRKMAQTAVREEDPTYRPSREALREPSFSALVYFLVVYTAAVNLNNPAVCNAALLCAAVYTPVTFLYQYVCATEHYLSLNKRTCNLPSRRIYGIGSGVLAIFLLVFLIVVLLSFLTSPLRHYRDLRTWSAGIGIDYTQLIPEHTMEGADADPMAALIAEYGGTRPAPQWLIYLSYVMEAGAVLIFAIMLLKRILATFHDFRGTVDDNGDLVEELTETAEEEEKAAIPAARRRLSERERVRKEYRRVIRRHRKDRPAAYESPAEIEANAGIAGSESGRELHRLYEMMRYGRE